MFQDTIWLGYMKLATYGLATFGIKFGIRLCGRTHKAAGNTAIHIWPNLSLDGSSYPRYAEAKHAGIF